MTVVDTTAVRVDIFPDEFKPIMKAVKYALLCDDSRKVLTGDEWSLLNAWLDDFSSIALNEGI
jgi:hypothetical protein